MAKNIYYIGGGPASIISAIYLKMHHRDVNVFVIERNDQPLKKLKMTGNGKCNISPLKDESHRYTNQLFVEKLFKDISLNEYLNILNEIGIATKTIKEYGYYPVSESAPNVAKILLNKCKELNIGIIKDTIADYRLENNHVTLLGNNNKYEADKAVFSVGGLAHPETGSDGNLIKVFKDHGYSIVDLKPSLCPIKVKDNIKDLFGVRGEGKVSLLYQDKVIKEEYGEVMFKKDALSGICVMNLSKYIVGKPNDYKIKVDLLNDINPSFSNGISVSDYLLSLVKEPLKNYVMNKLGLKETILNKETFILINNCLRGMAFNVDSLYDFKEAQVTRGGISLEDINEKFSSKLEENVYFIGEVIDVDGECGGYNLRFYITSGIKLSKSLFQ